MKRVLITGENGYIGTFLKHWLEEQTNEYEVEMIGVRDAKWRNKDFKRYHTIVHAAAIVHKKENVIEKGLYEQINHHLAVDLYKKCEEDQVKQFILISTAGVYEEKDSMIRSVVIGHNSKIKPYTEYGKSKLRAETDIRKLYEINGITKVAVVRPPLVYGPGCPGNYSKLAKLASNLLVIPDIKNQRSMIYIENLCEFFRFLIDGEMDGIFLPQNSEYVCTTELMCKIAEAHRRHPLKTKLFNPVIRLLSRRITDLNKIYGSNVYEWECSNIGNNYCLVPFEESVIRTEMDKQAKKR